MPLTPTGTLVGRVLHIHWILRLVHAPAGPAQLDTAHSTMGRSKVRLRTPSDVLRGGSTKGRAQHMSVQSSDPTTFAARGVSQALGHVSRGASDYRNSIFLDRGPAAPEFGRHSSRSAACDLVQTLVATGSALSHDRHIMFVWEGAGRVFWLALVVRCTRSNAHVDYDPLPREGIQRLYQAAPR